MAKQLAVIKGVRCGVGDYGRFAIWFSTYVSESSAALQVFEREAACDLVEEYGIGDVHQLEGKPCWVERDGNLIRWVGAFKP